MAPVHPPTRRSTARFTTLVAAIAVAAIAAVAVLVVRYDAAAGDRDEARQALSESEADLTQADDDLAEIEEQLAQRETSLAESAAILANVEAKVASIEANLANAEADLAERESTVSEYRDATADFLALALVSGIGITDDEATCTARALLESLGPDALGRLAGDEPESFELEAMRAASDCGVPLDAFEVLAGFAYGDNPTLDELHDGCAAGIGASCDELYHRSGAQTEYESFAVTCGGRFDLHAAPPVCDGSI